ncbi:hypothetical protein [Roseospirillum parvum]|uniref:FlgN protein n=1 Tax=Roseospirillum parvum TaxID=83401 RepID=A0A1G8FU90_9PROT|nr:hypothetical protein [Roseospirillum parvum]SDH85699.1 hypothetical protein SAMN05421742_11623 [Roseospirillum parvum]
MTPRQAASPDRRAALEARRQRRAGAASARAAASPAEAPEPAAAASPASPSASGPAGGAASGGASGAAGGTVGAEPAEPIIRPDSTLPRLGAQARGKAGDLYDVASELCALLADENAALEANRTERVGVLAERKRRLARLYQEQMRALAADPERLKALPEADREAFTTVARRLEKLSGTNGRLLKARMTAANRLLEAVVDAARRHHQDKVPSYSRQGALPDGADSRRKAVACYKTL